MFVGAGAAFVGASIGISAVVGGSDGAEHRFVIPAGTAVRLAAGELVEVIPPDLRFRLRDRLVIVNDDSAPHVIGPFSVAPGGRLETRLSEAATYDAICSLHPTGGITIEISDGA